MCNIDCTTLRYGAAEMDNQFVSLLHSLLLRSEIFVAKL